MGMVSIDKINTDKLGNVRKAFDRHALQELAESIKEHGIQQPLVALGPNKDGSYDLVFGGRRLAAARILGMKMVPVTVRKMKQADVPILQIIENIQREDLTPLEEAEAYAALKADHKMGVNEIARKIGKSAGHVSQRLKLLRMDDKVKGALQGRQITPTDARVISSLPPEEQADALTEAMSSVPAEPEPPKPPDKPKKGKKGKKGKRSKKQRQISQSISESVNRRRGRPPKNQKPLEERYAEMQVRLLEKFSADKEGWGEEQTAAFKAVLDFLLAEKVLMVG